MSHATDLLAVKHIFGWVVAVWSQAKDLLIGLKIHYFCFIVSFSNIAKTAHHTRKHYINWTIIERCMSGCVRLLVITVMDSKRQQFLSGGYFLSDVSCHVKRTFTWQTWINASYLEYLIGEMTKNQQNKLVSEGFSKLKRSFSFFFAV